MKLAVKLDTLAAQVRDSVSTRCRVDIGVEEQGAWVSISVPSPGLRTGARAGTAKALHDTVTRQILPDLLIDLDKVGQANVLRETKRADVLLEPFLAAVLVHECIGHTSEADNYEEYGHLLGIRLGDYWTPAPLTVTDDPTASAHNGAFTIDDEGTPASRIELLRDGVWTGLLTSRQHMAGQPPNGHGRKPPGSSAPAMPRIAHLRVDPGSTPSDHLASSLTGYRLGGIDGAGSVRDLVLIRPRWAQRYVNGEPKEIITNLEIRARKTQLMRRLTAIGKDITTFDPYHPCSKNGQDVPVTMSAPHLLLNDIRLYPGSPRRSHE